MAHKVEKNGRNQTGYGSSYCKGQQHDLGKRDAIGAVLGGQVWLVKPDRKAELSHPCLWMQAGVVKFKRCNNFYDCTRCKYDQGMQAQVAKGRQISWQAAMKRKPALERLCRHSLTQRIAERRCAYDYECAHCDFDQFFEDVWNVKTRTVPTEVEHIKGFDFPMDHYFHNGHTWARVESGGNIRIGLDDFSLKLLGSADSFDLPLMGKELDSGRVGWGLKRGNNQADVLAPVDGVIVEVNSGVRENPQLASREPYGGGWLFLVRTPDVKKSMQQLMTHAAGLQWINSEIGKLEDMIETVAGPLAADGGMLQQDIYGNLPALGWTRLTETFLKT